MDGLDILLLVLCAAFGLSGYRQGFIVGVLSFAGLIGGALLGVSYAPSLHRLLGLHGASNSALFGLIAFVVLAGLGQVLGTFIGAVIRNRLTWSPARRLDAVGGAALGIVSVLLLAGLVGTAATSTSFPTVNREVTNSQILGVVYSVLPDELKTIDPAFRRLLDASGFPQVFNSFGPEHIESVSPPDRALAHSAVVRRTEPSVVKIRGVAPTCSRQIEGSGFVISPQHVMTNAHVVAGVRSPNVTLSDGTTSYAAHVVLYDPNRDVAVLDVPGLTAQPLPFAGPAQHGDSAIVLGYPENGPFTSDSARIREVQQAQGLNIYQDHQVSRQIYSLYATVRPGNSGGPLITTSGAVDGVVFAASTDNAQTGYALTAHEVSGDAARGRAATATVSTQGCD